MVEHALGWGRMQTALPVIRNTCVPLLRTTTHGTHSIPGRWHHIVGAARDMGTEYELNEVLEAQWEHVGSLVHMIDKNRYRLWPCDLDLHNSAVMNNKSTIYSTCEPRPQCTLYLLTYLSTLYLLTLC